MDGKVAMFFLFFLWFVLCVESVSVDSGSWLSTTSPTKPMTHDKLHYFMPYWDNKPCMHVRSVWPDYRRRMYNSNIIGKIAEKLVRNNKSKNFNKIKQNNKI